ncbi:MAG: GDSL-type esterase/lipase family protein, partial [Bacteroidales bacterium]
NAVKIIFLGDSITYGLSSGVSEENTFRSLSKGFLHKQHFNAEVINEGISGETADKAYQRLKKDVLDQQPDVVVIMYGTNDSFVDRGTDHTRLPLDEYKRRITNIVSQLQKAGIEPILMTPPPLGNLAGGDYEPYTGNGKDFFIKPYVAACREIADNYKILLVDNYQHWKEKMEFGSNYNDWLSDGVHPNAIGHQVIAQTLFPSLIIAVNNGNSNETIIQGGKAIAVVRPGNNPADDTERVTIQGVFGDLYAAFFPSKGDFEVNAEFRISGFQGTVPHFVFFGSELGFDASKGQIILKGDLAGNSILTFPKDDFQKDWVDLKVKRASGKVQILINETEIYSAFYIGDMAGELGFLPGGSEIQIRNFAVWGNLIEMPAKSKIINIPTIDISGDDFRQVIVDKEKGQYLGHPTTLLLEDNKTLFVVYPKGHGSGGIIMKKSLDAGFTWSDRIPVPESWETSKEVPTLYPLKLENNNDRFIMFSGLYPIRVASSDDLGNTWSELNPVFNYGGIVATSDLIRLKDGTYMTFFHDNGKFYTSSGKNINKFIVYKTTSMDGLSWSDPEVVVHHKSASLCEAGIIRSPDGNRIAMLLRENSRVYNSMVIFSDDEGDTWTVPVELPASLTGDRHQLVYAPDGRIFAAFRDMAKFSETQGDFVGWVGTWDDIANCKDGQYRVRLLDNKDYFDCGYPGLEILPDGTIIATTYGHWESGEKPYIKCIRFKLEDIDKIANSSGKN